MAELKQKQKFEENWTRFTKLSTEERPEKVAKVDQNEVLAVFEKVAKKRIDAAKEKFETKVEAILDAKLALDKTLKQGAEELAKKEEKEYEELNKQLSEAFGMLNNAKQQNQNLVQQAGGNFAEPGSEAKAEETKPVITE